MKRAGLAAIVLLVVGCASAAQAVTVSAFVEDFDFVADDQLEVDIFLEQSQGLTALELSVVYPSNLLAVDLPTTHTNGSFNEFSHMFIDHEADSTDLPDGFRRITMAFSVAQPTSWTAGHPVTVLFPLRCADFSGDWPQGRSVTIEIQDVEAWAVVGSEIPEPVAASGEGVTVDVDCTTVPVDGLGFSTLKARHTGKGGVR